MWKRCTSPFILFLILACAEAKASTSKHNNGDFSFNLNSRTTGSYRKKKSVNSVNRASEDKIHHPNAEERKKEAEAIRTSSLTHASVRRGGGAQPPGGYSPFFKFFGILLAFNSGYLNGSFVSGFLGLNGVQNPVAAFTGAYTFSAVALAEKNMTRFWFQLKMILSYIFGASISSVFSPQGAAATPNKLEPLYGPSFLIGGVCILVSMIQSSTATNYVPFYLAAIANGITNSITSMYSANVLRTSHFTGISTDIGIFVGQLLRGNNANKNRLKMIVMLALSFWTGSFVSFFATKEFQSKALLVNAAIFLLFGGKLVIDLMKGDKNKIN